MWQESIIRAASKHIINRLSICMIPQRYVTDENKTSDYVLVSTLGLKNKNIFDGFVLFESD